jgi:hypothetical protein
MRISLPFLRRKTTTVVAEDVDPISLFDSEAGLEAALDPSSVRAAVRAIVRGVAPVHAVAASQPASDQVTVDAIIGRKTQVFWTEAVAIVHGASQQATAETIPDRAGILLTSTGGIELEPSRRAASVDDLARTLHVLVSGEQIPAPLRLFISKWITPADVHALPDFTRELAYFARPDSEALIRAVYERHLKTAAAALPVAKPGEPPRPVEKKPKRKVAVPRGAVVAVVALAVAGGATFLAQAWMRAPRGASPVSTVAAAITASTGLSGLTGPTGAPLDGERAGKTDTELPAPKPARNRASSARATATQARTESSGPALAPQIQIDAGTIDFFGRPSVAAAANRPAQSAGVASADSRPTAPEPSPEHVYTVSDPEVKPPLMLYPTLPPVLSINGDTNSMEVVVSRDGNVERVRLISVAKRMTDMMLLSGAKTWRFQPASLSGEPVRYRMVVSWSATP